MNLLIFFVIVLGLSDANFLSYTTLKYVKNRALDIIDNAGPKDDCSRHLKAMVGDLFNWKNLWAMEMLDSSAKFQTGFFDGNIYHFGSFDQCLRIREVKEDIIEGQYCTVALAPSKNSTNDLGQLLDFTNTITKILGKQEGNELKHILRLVKMIYGICIPKSCTADNLQKIWNHVEFTFRLPVHVSVGEDFCTYKGKVSHTFQYDGQVISAFGIFFLFLCFATLYDIAFSIETADSKIWNDIITSFSFRRNMKKVFHISSGTCEENKFSCIMGLKVLSMFWVILGHKYTISYFSGSTNMLEFFEFRKTLPALLVLVSPFAVDTFLSISGLLLAYKYLQLREMLPPNKSFPYFMFYLMRFLRLWPALLASVLLYLNILKYLNDGPLWPLYSYKTAISCRYTGLATVLFATNQVPFYTQCLEHTWYLAVDTQLYCIAPLILYFLYYYPKRTSFFLVLLTSILSVRSYFITYLGKHKWSPSEGDDSFHSEIYMSVLVRMPVWICGMLTGAFLYSHPHVRINKIVAKIMWTILMLLFLLVFYANNYLISHPYNEHHAGLFNALARPAWGMAICLIIILCATGNGGFINKLLSLNIYQPITKISYSVFLIHSAVLLTVHGGKRTPVSHNLFTTVHSLLGDMPILMCASLIWCLAFESPFIHLTKMMYTRGSTIPGAIENKKTFPEFKAAKKESRSKATKLE